MMQFLYFDAAVTAGEAYINDSELHGQNVFGLSSQQQRYTRNYRYGMVYQNPVHGLKMDFSSVGNIAEKLIAAGNRYVNEMEAISTTLMVNVNIPLFRMTEELRNCSGGL